MSTWRWQDEATPQAQADLDGMFGPAPDFAWSQLAKRGAFFPYAYALRASGEAQMIHAAPSADGSRPTSLEVIGEWRQALFEQRDQLRATAIVADVRLQDGRDAIRIEFEHADGLALTVLLPYKKKRFSRKIERGEQIVTHGPRLVWA